MLKDSYDFVPSKSHYFFKFHSEGPKGKILKVVSFESKNIKGEKYFNLTLGDWDAKKRRLDDHVVTNNNDRDKVLATVAYAVYIFTKDFPQISVYAEGSTKARTRLYQIAIAIHWQEIDPIMEVYGLLNGKWESFKKNTNYEAFYVQRKKGSFIL